MRPTTPNIPAKLNTIPPFLGAAAEEPVEEAAVPVAVPVEFDPFVVAVPVPVAFVVPLVFPVAVTPPPQVPVGKYVPVVPV